MKALSIRQPHAELIMRGIKTVEYRCRPTRVRGRIYIYATARRCHRDDKAECLEEYGIDTDSLPLGVIVGTVELYDSDDEKWMLRRPERARELRKPDFHPMPVWFNPFRDEIDETTNGKRDF